MQKSQSPPITDQIKAVEAQAFKPLAFLAKTTLRFVGTDFGPRALNPLLLVGVPVAFAVYHDAISLFGRLGDPPFFHSWAKPFVIAFEIAAAAQIVLAWVMYWRGRPQLSYYLGTPFLTLLHIPFSVAWVLNIALVFIAGMELRRLDHALGIWVMFAAAGMTMVFAFGTQQQAKDRLDMSDAQIYSGNVQTAVKKRREPAVQPAASDDLSTGI